MLNVFPEMVQRIFKCDEFKIPSLLSLRPTFDKELNILVNGMPFCVITYRSYTNCYKMLSSRRKTSLQGAF